MAQPVFSQVAIQLHPEDPVAIAKQAIIPGTTLIMPSGGELTIQEFIPAGHKFALQAIAAGEPVLRYGHRIGVASSPVSPGGWVHSHNLTVGEISTASGFKVVPRPTSASARDSFLGYHRPDGRVGTRNYIAVISTVSCSAHVTAEIARAFPPEKLAPYANVDGVIPILHHSGCSIPTGELAHRYLQRTLGNVALHPNIGGYLFIGLGCEINQMDGVYDCMRGSPAGSLETLLPPGQGLVIQELGGFRKTVSAGINAIEDLLPQVNACERTPQPVSELILALQCGGSDGWSGITANPLVGSVADEVISQGGTAVLSETPEIFGAEQLLTQRVASPEAGQKLIERLTWWNDQAQKYGFSIDNNPTPGNKKGGLTTIFEKSLGAVAKGGRTPLVAVYEYGERIDRKGLVFMDAPGNDPVSITGQLAGGCNLILFPTGRGSVYGSNLAPCIKISSNSALYQKMSDDIDYNAGQILEGTALESAAKDLFQVILATAGGQKTSSEEKGLPDSEFVPWQPGPVL